MIIMFILLIAKLVMIRACKLFRAIKNIILENYLYLQIEKKSFKTYYY